MKVKMACVHLGRPVTQQLKEKQIERGRETRQERMEEREVWVRDGVREGVKERSPNRGLEQW